MTLLQHVRVVIRQLFAGSDVPNRIDPDSPILDDRVAVGITGVVDESCIVSIHRGIDDDIIVDGEEISMMPLLRIIRISLVRLLWSETLAGVFDQARARRDRTNCKSAEPLNR